MERLLIARFDFYAAQENTNSEAIRFPYTPEQFRAEFEDWIALQNKMVAESGVPGDEFRPW
jgi:hypothetical protein